MIFELGNFSAKYLKKIAPVKIPEGFLLCLSKFLGY